MAAEDYLEGLDEWDGSTCDAEPWPRKRRMDITCNRCGASGFHWEQVRGDWRLFDSRGQLHLCKSAPLPSIRPSPESILSSTTIISQVLPSTTKEPIMDKNAVAFIRNDVISIGVQFPSGQNSSIQLDPKSYTYLTTDRSIVVGDWVIVQVGEVFKCACVTFANGELEIEPNSAVTYKYIVGKVDTTQYVATAAANAKIEDMLKTTYRSTLREGFRQTLLAGLDAEKQASLSIILNTTSKE